MKTQNILRGIRLMTFSMVLSMLAFNANAISEEDELKKAGKGEGEKTEERVDSDDRIEEWMLEEKNFTVKGNEVYSVDWVYTTETEHEIQLEDWMINSERFTIQNNSELDQIESWMIDYENFRIRKEDELDRIEDWMIDSDFWQVKN